MTKSLRLTHAEEIELTRALSDNDEGSRRYRRALDKLVTHNLGLVNKIVDKFPLRNASCTFEDLFQEGVAGLIHGIRKFDPARGYRLSTYVYNWISVYVRRYYQNHGRTVRVPIHMSMKNYNLTRQIEDLTEQLGRTPTQSEIDKVNGNANKITTAMSSIVSLNQLTDSDSGRDYSDRFVSYDPSESFDTTQDAETLLSQVKPLVSARDYQILIRRFGLDGDSALTLSEIADEYGITRARVHQIENRVLNKLRQLAA